MSQTTSFPAREWTSLVESDTTCEVSHLLGIMYQGRTSMSRPRQNADIHAYKFNFDVRAFPRPVQQRYLGISIRPTDGILLRLILTTNCKRISGRTLGDVLFLAGGKRSLFSQVYCHEWCRTFAAPRTCYIFVIRGIHSPSNGAHLYAVQGQRTHRTLDLSVAEFSTRPYEKKKENGGR